MIEELKPCPFCGGHAQFVWVDPAEGVYGISCQECKAYVRWNITMGPWENYGDNMKKWAGRWNRRSGNEG